MKVLALLPALLLLLLPTLAEGRLVDIFDEDNCGQFFFPNPADQNTPIIPTILHREDDKPHYKKICQMYNYQRRFATLYDTTNRIPVYSAYTFDMVKVKGEEEKTHERAPKPSKVWMIEPQLESDEADANMIDEKDQLATTSEHQALDDDYKFTGYDRGHLYPEGYGYDKLHSLSTRTLTNIAPQLGNHNKEWAFQVEEPLLKMIKGQEKDKGKDRCVGTGVTYIVTGVVPGDTWLKENLEENKVKVPSHFWTAYCCDGKDGQKLSGAFWSTHKEVKLSKGKNPTIDFVDKMKVCELETELHKEYFNAELSNACEPGNQGDNTEPVPYRVFGGRCG